MKRQLLATVAAATLASGCTTHLASYRDREGPAVSAGPAYRLPVLQFDITTTRILTQCVGTDGKPEVLFAAKLVAEPAYVAGETYVLDHGSLASGSKITSMSLTAHKNGTISGINVAAEDRTRPILKSVVGLGFDVARLATGIEKSALGFESTEERGSPSGWVCSNSVAIKLASIDTLSDQLDEDRISLEKIGGRIATLERIAASAGLNAAQQAAYEKLAGQQAVAAALVARKAAALARLVADVTVTETVTWLPTQGETGRVLAPSLATRKKLEGFFKDSNGALLQRPGGMKPEDFEAKIALAVAFNASPLATADAAAPGYPAKLHPTPFGLFYRNPRPGRLVGCRTADIAACAEGRTRAELRSDLLMAPQLGALRSLPMSNGAFQNNEMKAGFGEDGTLASFSYQDKDGWGEALSAALADAATQGLAFNADLQTQRASDAAKAKSADLDAINDQIARIEAQKKLNGLLAETSEASSLAPLKAETAMINARLALEEARTKFELSRSNGGTVSN